MTPSSTLPLLLLVAAAAAAAATEAGPAPGGLLASLQGAAASKGPAPAGEAACGQPWCVAVSLRNPTAAAVRVAPEAAALEPLDAARRFEVRERATGRRLRYVGAMVKRRAPTEDEMAEVPAGGAVRATVDLSTGYELRAGVEYEASFGGATHRFTAAADSVPPHLQGARAAEPQFLVRGCSGNTWALSASLGLAKARVEEVYNDFYARRCTNTAYTQWFRTPNAERYTRVVNTYRKIAKTINDDNYRVECNAEHCASNIFAYVYPGDSTLTVHVCGAYESATNAGFDTKFGTMIHEFSHFNTIGGTDDHEYGFAIQQLAADTAVDNAETYEYMVESYFDQSSAPVCSSAKDSCLVELGTAASYSATCEQCVPASGSTGSCGWCASTKRCVSASSGGPSASLEQCLASTFADALATCSNATNNAGGDDDSGGGGGGGGGVFGGCFSASAQVQLEGGARVALSQLNPGDRVLSADGDGNLFYDKVFRVTHWDQRVVAEHVRVVTDAGQRLELTPDHYLHAGTLDNKALKLAGDLREGDELFVVAGAGGRLTAARVASAERVRARGLFNVHTLSGRVVVNDVVASHFSVHSTWGEGNDRAAFWYKVVDAASTLFGGAQDARASAVRQQ